MALTKDRKTEVISSYRTHPSDTGSPEVQIAILSQRIEDLTQHFNLFAVASSTTSGRRMRSATGS